VGIRDKSGFFLSHRNPVVGLFFIYKTAFKKKEDRNSLDAYKYNDK
jgi:hypothetical protein